MLNIYCDVFRRKSRPGKRDFGILCPSDLRRQVSGGCASFLKFFVSIFVFTPILYFCTCFLFPCAIIERVQDDNAASHAYRAIEYD